MKLNIAILLAALAATASASPAGDISEVAVDADASELLVDPRAELPVAPRASFFIDARQDTNGTSQDEIDQWLTAHNDERAQHGPVPLVWNQDLQNAAMSWASRCVYKHNRGGQNIAARYNTRANFPREIDRAVGQWNNERGEYNATTFKGAGHWTQVVWKHSRNLGCAAYSCPQGTLGKKPGDKWKSLWYYVCNYDPKGNVVPASKYYPSNVQP
uniref:Fruiting body protein SC14 n=1 Tax=Schizophyllum commune TaxID=5334 RepID=SC14_SCHCO|nr:RecName: Full=Fruiting body protein SC14; Flags: Precursor [Schizophyllum commune]AAA16208.1 pSc14 protein [Schizophyllum commune]